MAKMKTYTVTVRWPVETTLVVQARKPSGVVDKLFTEEGWLEATAYQDDVPRTLPRGAEVVRVEVMS